MKKNSWIWIIAFIIALFIWFEINLTQIHKVILEIPIKFLNVPSTLVPLSYEPEKIVLTIEGSGKDILLYKLKKEFYSADLKNSHFGPFHYPIKLEKLDKLEEHKLEIIHKSPAKDIVINLDNLASKNVKVKPVFLNKKSKKNFEENNFDLSPKMMQLTGPKSIIKNIKEVETVPFNKKKHNKKSKINLQPFLDMNINLEKNYVMISQKIPQIKTKMLSEITISTPDGIEVLPSWTTIRISGEEEILSKITNEKISVTIDTTSLELDGYAKVLISIPDGIKLIEFRPERVKITKMLKKELSEK